MDKHKGWLVATFRITAACAVVVIVGYYFYATYTAVPQEIPKEVPEAVAGRASNPEQSAIQLEAPEAAAQPAENKIALLGNDFQIFTVSPDGKDLLQITQNRFQFGLPTWSPDGRRLAFRGVAGRGRGGLFASPTDRSAPTLLAPRPPTYFNWSPDSTSVTYLIAAQGGMALHEVSVSDPHDNQRRGVSLPFYWAWSPEPDTLVSHQGNRVEFSRGEETVRVTSPDSAARRFSAPVCSQDGKTAYYVAGDQSDELAIMAFDTRSFTSRLVSPVEGYCRMVLSPDSRYLAYVRSGGSLSTRAGKAYLIDLTTGEKSQPVDFNVAAIFFSPDGKRLAILSPPQEVEPGAVLPGGDETQRTGRMRGRRRAPGGVPYQWWIHDLTSGETSALVSLRMPGVLAQVMDYFDQMHPSHSFWSPDSRYLVTASRAMGRDEKAQVWVVDTEQIEPPVAVADGRFAVWSPQ